MDYRIFQSNLHDAHKVTKYCLWLCASQFLMIFLLILLSLFLSHRSMVTLVPMNLNAPISVSNNSVSSDYLGQSALSFINLRLNFDPDTIDKNHQIILKFVSSNSYPSLKKTLDEESQLVKEQSIASSFYINNIEINRSTLSALITGKLIRSVGHKTLPPVITQFLISFENNDGLLTIKQFVEQKVGDKND